MTDAEYLAVEKSTIVRSQTSRPALPFLRAGNRVLSAVAPPLAARLAERLFFTPPRPRRPAAELALLATARARPMRVGERRIEVSTWGAGPVVLLVHGWGGRGTQLGPFVDPLVARGFSVVAFDAPGHGAADRGAVTVVDIVRSVREVTAATGPLAGLIAHSLGAAATAVAMHEGLTAGAAAFIGPVADLEEPTGRFVETLGFSPRVGAALRDRVVRRVGRPWSAFDVATLAPALRAPLLVVHDRGDGEVPWQHGLAIARAWPGSELLLTDGLGHRRILRDPDVVARVVAFLAARTAERRLRPLADADVVESLPSLAW